MKVIVNMACGLANRMFQYSYYQYLLKEGYDVYVDYFKTKTLEHEDVEWSRIFPLATFRQADDRDIRRMGGKHDFFSRICRKYFPGLTSVVEMKTAFDIFLPYRDKDAYLLGVFQNAEIVENVDSVINNLFVFPEFESEKNRSLAEILVNENSVGIHIRKGKDYQTRIWYRNTCEIDYYKKAVDFVKSKVLNPRFYIFTDNPIWVKENMSWLDYILVEGNPGFGWGSHCDMQLMSLCKHNIISNSTYSWWGAYLNKNIDKIVICPKVWFNPQATADFTSDKLIVDKWTSL